MKKEIGINYSKIIKIAFIISIIAVLIIIFLSSRIDDAHKNVVFDKYNIINLDEDWRIEYDNISYEDNLPVSFDYKSGRKYTLYKNLDDIFYGSNYTLSLITDFSEFRIYLDDKSIYSFINTDFDEYKNLAKRIIHMVDLPEDFQNKELKIECIMKSNESLTYLVKDIMIGDSSLISNKIIFNDYFRLTITLLLIIFSIVLIFLVIVVLIYKLYKITDLFCICMFSIISTIYVFSESNLCTILIDNNILVNNLTYLSIILLPIPLLILAIDNMKEKKCGLIYFSAIMAMINLIAQVILNYSNIYDFRKMLIMSHIVIILSVIGVFVSVGINYMKNNEIKFNIGYTLPMSAGAVIDIVIFKYKILPYEGLLFQVGVIILVACELRDIALKYKKYYMLSIKTYDYKNIAYTDMMTKVGNRTAYEDKIDQINSELDTFESIWCISIDANNLKLVNDSYGHSFGDELIKSLAKILNSVFFNNGESYRIGGDEFVIFIYDISIEDMELLLKKFYDKIEEHNEYSELLLSVALGYDCYKNDEDNSILDCINRADKLMYENKKLLKEA